MELAANKIRMNNKKRPVRDVFYCSDMLYMVESLSIIPVMFLLLYQFVLFVCIMTCNIFVVAVAPVQDT